MREEYYHQKFIPHFHLKGNIGKRRNGSKNLSALKQERAVTCMRSVEQLL